MNEPKSETSSQIVTRRDFIKSSSVAVGGAAVLGGMAIERSAFAAGDDTIRVALIGCGGRGSGAAAQALSTKGNVKLVAMCDAFRDRLDGSYENIKKQHPDKVEVDEDHKFTGFDGYKHAIASADLVIMATPPGFRPMHFEEAVKQGKHVFMEKPVAVDAPGVRQVLKSAEEAKKKNLKVGVGLQRHHDRGYQETVKRLHGGELGDIVAMHCYWNGAGVWTRARTPEQTEMEYQMRNWYYFNWLCGDHITEQHIHNLDVINWVKNAYPVKAHGMGGREVRIGKDSGEIFDHHAVVYTYADGSVMFSYCRHIPGCWSNVSEHVVGSKGVCDVGGNWMKGHDGSAIWRHRKNNDPNPYQQEHDDLFDAIRNDKPFNEAEFGAKSSMTSILGRMCTYSGKEINWDDAIASEIDLSPKVYAWDAPPPVLPDEMGRYPIAVPGKTRTV